jgi:hypothetical protein
MCVYVLRTIYFEKLISDKTRLLLEETRECRTKSHADKSIWRVAVKVGDLRKMLACLSDWGMTKGNSNSAGFWVDMEQLGLVRGEDNCYTKFHSWTRERDQPPKPSRHAFNVTSRYLRIKYFECNFPSDEVTVRLNVNTGFFAQKDWRKDMCSEVAKNVALSAKSVFTNTFTFKCMHARTNA